MSDSTPTLRTRSRAAAVDAQQRLRYLASRFRADQCSQSAAALTYMSLFALVPLLTVVYTMASAVPAFRGLEDTMQGWLFQNLVPETSAEIASYLGEFSQQAKNLTGIGIGFLVVTAILMLRNIESAFNKIWRARKNRSAVNSFLLYWAVLSLAPITIGIGVGITTYLTSLSVFFEGWEDLGLIAYVLRMIPLLMSIATFTLLFVAVPNCRVPFRHALLGGVLTALVFSVARSVFTTLVAGSAYTFIYGAFAAVPLFLLWIYISWNILLTGAILVHSLSAYQHRSVVRRPPLLKALDVLYVFWRGQEAGRTIGELELVAGGKQAVRGLDSESWATLRDVLLDHRIIALDERGRYLLARDLSGIQLWQLKEWLAHEAPLATDSAALELPWQQTAYELLTTERAQHRELLSQPLTELFQGASTSPTKDTEAA